MCQEFYARRSMTIVELGDGLGIDPGDLAVLVVALGNNPTLS